MPKKTQKPKIVRAVSRDDEQLKNLIDWRRGYFTKLLGEDCPYLDALISKQDINREDVIYLLEKGCPVEIIPKILL